MDSNALADLALDWPDAFAVLEDMERLRAQAQENGQALNAIKAEKEAAEIADRKALSRALLEGTDEPTEDRVAAVEATRQRLIKRGAALKDSQQALERRLSAVMGEKGSEYQEQVLERLGPTQRAVSQCCDDLLREIRKVNALATAYRWVQDPTTAGNRSPLGAVNLPNGQRVSSEVVIRTVAEQAARIAPVHKAPAEEPDTEAHDMTVRV